MAEQDFPMILLDRELPANSFLGSLLGSLLFLIHIHFLGDLTKGQHFKYKLHADSSYMCLRTGPLELWPVPNLRQHVHRHLGLKVSRTKLCTLLIDLLLLHSF